MPIYEYRCPSCGRTYEELVRLGASDAPPCPSCGAKNARRLVSAIARSGVDCAPGGG